MEPQSQQTDLDLILVIPGHSSRSEIVQHLESEILLAHLRGCGFRVKIFDQALAEPHLSESQLFAASCQLACFPHQAIFWYLPTRHEFHALTLNSSILERCSSTKSLWIAGGFFASHHDAQILDALPILDAVVRGEMERPVESVCHALRDRTSWHSIPGLTFRAQEKLIRNQLASDLPDITQLPAAADDLFHPSRLTVGQKILFNRGCNSDCQYCGLQRILRDSFPEKKKFWRSREASKIVDEIELYSQRHDVSRFIFYADVFFGYDSTGSSIVEQVAQDLLERQLDIRFQIVTHPNHLVRNQHLLPRLIQAGLDKVILGADSGSESALRRYRVDFDKAQNLEALEILHTHRLLFKTAFIFYDPLMSLAEVAEQLRFLRRIAPFYRHMLQSYPWFLDHQLLHTELKITAAMPMTETLAVDGRISESTWKGAPPKASFRDPAVARFYRIHQAAKDQHLRLLRPLLWNRECVDRYPSLNFLPIDLLEHLLDSTRDLPDLCVETAMKQAALWLEDTIGNDLPEMASAIGSAI